MSNLTINVNPPDKKYDFYLLQGEEMSSFSIEEKTLRVLISIESPHRSDRAASN